MEQQRRAWWLTPVLVAVLVIAVVPDEARPTVDVGGVARAVQAHADQLGQLGQVGVVPGGRPAGATAGMAAARFAASQLRDRYAWGAAGPDAWDCSGLTRAAWAKAGVRLPRAAADQYQATVRIHPSQARAGDLVFYPSRGPTGWHVAIVSGPGRMVEAAGAAIRVRETRIRPGARGYGRPTVGGR
jgi:cell wall-associated NlpC family hydrolase